MERRTRRNEERVDKKAIVSVRVSEVACPEGSPHRRAAVNVNGVGCIGAVVPALMLALAASTGTQGTSISSNDNGNGNGSDS